jgi:hypothetical protein
MFLLVEEDVTTAKGKKNTYSMWRVVWESLGSCMLVTLLLDFVRIGLTDVSFTMKEMKERIEIKPRFASSLQSVYFYQYV